MSAIYFDQKSYFKNGERVYLNSGEFHYFRVPRQDWRTRMRLFKDAGGNCLGTYIPWLIHEPQEGEFVFSGGDGKLDLEEFLQTAGEEGLAVIARPGPYQYSELRYSGLPAWLCEEHPEILALDHDGNALRKSAVCYLHPYFLKKAKVWYDQVLPIIARNAVSNQGSVSMIQFDNELAGIQVWSGSLDYHPALTQTGEEDGRYARFLRAKYGTVDALNQAYAGSCKHFVNVMPPDKKGAFSPAAFRARKDYFEFYRETLAEYAAILVGWFREAGIDLPVVHNSAGPAMNRYFQETVQRLGNDFLLGTDHYYNLGQGWKQNNPTGQLFVREFCSLETLRLLGSPPTVFELPGGSLSDWPPIGPVDAKACYFSNLASGMKGHNYYIFTGGPNPPGAGKTCDIYDYGAGIGADGEIRPLYHVQKEFGLFIKENPWLAAAETAFDCRFAMDLEYQCVGEYATEFGHVLMPSGDAWDFTRTGPLTSAFCAGFSPKFCNLASNDWVTDTDTPLVVVCGSLMAADKQQRIVNHLESGGKVLVLPVLPELDENFNPCTILQDFLGKPTVRPIDASLVCRLDVGDIKNIFVNGKIFVTEEVPADAEPFATESNSNALVAWTEHCAGGGQALFLGLSWTHAKVEHNQLFSRLMTALGGRQTVACSNPNIWTTLRTDGEHAMLFAMNFSVSPMQAELAVEIEPGKRLNLGSYTIEGMTVKTIPVEH